MGDVADILGINSKENQSSSSSDNLLLGSVSKMKKSTSSSSVMKPKGISREVYSLLGKDGLVPAITSSFQPAAFKSKWVNNLKGKWMWAPIKPFSARRFEILNFLLLLFYLIAFLFPNYHNHFFFKYIKKSIK